MIELRELGLRRGARVLLEDVDQVFHAGQRVGVTGANGCGKSSLFALIRGELEPDRGSCTVPAGSVIAHVAQHTPAVERPALEYVVDGDRELRAAQATLTKAERDGDGFAQARAHELLEALDGYTAQARAARLMRGLGFTAEQESAPVRSFSGGWRMRLNLGQALMRRSDLLLLDEPTNHLDLDAVIWLEEWLSRYAGTLLLISHDRDFLDRVVHHVAHIENRTLTLYAGGYSDFEIQRAERVLQARAAFEKQARESARIRRFVDRFRAKATKARQVQSRLKALARMEASAPAHFDSPFRFSIPRPEKTPNPLLRLRDAQGGYDGREVLGALRVDLAPGDRVALLGRNGAGKSTLVKLLAGVLAPISGTREEGPGLRVGYFAQHQIEQLDPHASPLAHLRRLDPDTPEQELRDFLGGFAFSGEVALEPVAPRSGGEKARLVLALLVFQRPNLLLLDEPTNHLDLEMRHALNVALQEFEGALVLVSHDRHLLRSAADDLLLVADARVRPFEGDLEDYRRWLLEEQLAERNQAKAVPTAAHSAHARRERRRDAAEQRRRTQPLRAGLARLEAEIERLSARKADLDQQLAEPSLYAAEAKDQLKALLLEQAAVDGELGHAEERWLALGEQIEAAEQGP